MLNIRLSGGTLRVDLLERLPGNHYLPGGCTTQDCERGLEEEPDNEPTYEADDEKED